MGECPDWYETIRVARFLGVAPWDLVEQPVLWHNWAHMSMQAEAAAREQQEQAQVRRRRMQERQRGA